MVCGVLLCGGWGGVLFVCVFGRSFYLSWVYTWGLLLFSVFFLEVVYRRVGKINKEGLRCRGLANNSVG